MMATATQHLFRRLKPAALSMPVSFVSVLFVVAAVSVGMSDGASVPITLTTSATPTTDLDDLESLVSSKILMDHPSSTSSSALKISRSFQHQRRDEQDDHDGDGTRLVENGTTVAAAGSHDKVENGSKEEDANNKKAPSSHQNLASAKVSSLPQSSSGSSSKNERNSYEMSSPLHVARCRATCLQEFHQKAPSLNSWTTRVGTTPPVPSGETNTSADEMHLSPILRLRKRRSTSPNLNGFVNNNKLPTWSCLQDSPDCLSCWKSCELLEPRETTTTSSSSESIQQDVSSAPTGSPAPQGTVNEAGVAKLNETKNVVAKKEGKGKPSILACSSMNSKQCMAGCQVACSFYEKLSADKGENERTTEQEPQEKAFKGDPVVATRHGSVLKIVPGKMIWPQRNDNAGKKEASSLSSAELGKKESAVMPVVYVVIQEYPDRKWRQIAQTTSTNIDIPTELTSAMSTKLRSVRVLVVGPYGLLSVYSPEKVVGEQETLSDNNGNNSGKEPSTTTTTTTAATAKTGMAEAAIPAHQEKDSDSNNKDNLETTAAQSENVSVVVLVDSTSSTNTNDHFETSVTKSSANSVSSGNAVVVVTDSTVTTPVDNEMGGVVGEPFELRVVSLIHQKSLVIAELKWDEIGGNPNLEYLITWELTGGGLKGHLVTDSTSVTLSLWPDTTYRIQVEEFQQNLDADGEQAAVESSPTSLKSLPLTVDTGEASFPMERPSALLGATDEEEGEDDYENEDVSGQEGSVTRERDEVPQSAHKSITAGGFLNMTLMLGIAISALVFVLVILAVAAFTWTRMRALTYSSGDGSTSPMISPAKSLRNEPRGASTGFYADDKNGCCYNSGYYYSSSNAALSEPQPLLSQEEFYWEDQCNHNHHLHHHLHHTPTHPSYSSPASSPHHYPAELSRDSNMLYSFEIPHGKGPKSSTVAVISSASTSCSAYGDRAPSPSSYLNYYGNDIGSSSLAYSLLSNRTGAPNTTIAAGKLGCPSLSSSSSCELP